jgi:hypothetical protein
VNPTTAERKLADGYDEFFGEAYLAVSLFMSFGYLDDGGPLGAGPPQVLLAGQAR